MSPEIGAKIEAHLETTLPAKNMSDLKDRTALVTGASRGIGFAISECLAGAGASVVLNGRDPDTLSGAVAALRERGYSADSAAFDVTREAEIELAFREIRERFGYLDILVNNAGVVLAKDVFETTSEEWGAVLQSNLTSAFLCSRAALRIMRDSDRGGRIVMIGSTAGQRGAPSGAVAYSASKAGLSGLTQTLAYTAAPLGVTVNMVAPGMILTDMLRKGFGAGLDAAANKVPIGLGQPEDVARAVLYLVSDAARYVTGATIDVNGGLYLR